MKLSPWPDKLDNVFAKSKKKGGDTLAEHTCAVLQQLARLRHLRPTLPTLAETPELWHLLFWTCLLHDFGKAASGFQEMLATEGDQRWPHRHEVLSLACFDWIAPSLSEAEQRAIVAAIVSHHRDAKNIRELYPIAADDALRQRLQEISPEVASKLWHWVDVCADPWAQALGFAPGEVRSLTLMSHDDAMASFQRNGAARVRFWLDCYQDWVEDLPYQSMQQALLPILLRGLTTTADHLASSNLNLNLALPAWSWKYFSDRILDKEKEEEAFHHQQESAARNGRSALLVSPTGSGKTEAALYWALGDGTRPVARLFYALPYQASMNAMKKRLSDAKKGFGKDVVGLQHGRAVQAMYLSFADQASTTRTREERAKREKNINTLHARPLKIFSPYQMLKAAFRLRGFESMLTDYAQADFIFDEIHAYDPARLALICEMMRFLRQHFQARFFVMSATFPDLIRERLFDVLDLQETDVITADKTIFEKFRRHRLHLLDGELATQGIAPIVRDVRAGKKVLACVNTVKGAQRLCADLQAKGLASEQIIMIHSRFTMRDRIALENDIMRRCPLRRKDEFLEEAAPFVLVATQVVEVSLNIDLDTIYTEPAPLEALLQRFGRVNRACEKGICPVYVFRVPLDGQGVYGRHRDKTQSGHIVRLTLAELERHNGDKIDESEIGDWLNTIYADPQLCAEWTQTYQQLAANAANILSRVRPFDSDPQTEDKFEELFDAVEVLPHELEKKYVNHIIKGEFIEASLCLVSISQGRFHQLCNQRVVTPIIGIDDRHKLYKVCLPYNAKLGLQFEQPAEDAGL